MAKPEKNNYLSPRSMIYGRYRHFLCIPFFSDADALFNMLLLSFALGGGFDELGVLT